MKLAGTRGVIDAVEVGDPVAVGRDDHRLVLTQLDGFAGEFDEGRDIGAEEHLTIADAHHEGVERRAAMMVPGSSAWVKTSVKCPSRRRRTASTEPSKSPAVGPWPYACATR